MLNVRTYADFRLVKIFAFHTAAGCAKPAVIILFRFYIAGKAEKAGFNNGLRQSNVFTHAFAPGLRPVQINKLINGTVQQWVGIIKVNKCGSLFFGCFGLAKNTYFFIIFRQPCHIYFGCRFSGLTGFNRIFNSCFRFCNASCRNGFIICFGRLALF